MIVGVSQQYELIRYNHSDDDAWEKIVSDSANGTFLHSRKFISYHGDKFDDQSLLIYDQDHVLRAVFPAATDLNDQTIVVSHPGITYGGIIHDGWLRGQRCLDLLTQLSQFYAKAGFKEIIYKAVPWIYHRIPVQDDIYALQCLQALRYRVDLSAIVDLQNRGAITNRRNRVQKKVMQSGLRVSNEFGYINQYWQILADNLGVKYNKQPVHSIEELCSLKEKFPQQIELVTAIDNDTVVAGSILFNCPTLIHAQYFASNQEGKKIGALDLVIEYCLERSKQLGKKFFDFGISTDKQGQELNDSLHTFKCEFGAGTAVYEFYRLIA